jgi:hypothetical protein
MHKGAPGQPPAGYDGGGGGGFPPGMFGGPHGMPPQLPPDGGAAPSYSHGMASEAGPSMQGASPAMGPQVCAPSLPRAHRAWT